LIRLETEKPEASIAPGFSYITHVALIIYKFRADKHIGQSDPLNIGKLIIFVVNLCNTGLFVLISNSAAALPMAGNNLIPGRILFGKAVVFRPNTMISAIQAKRTFFIGSTHLLPIPKTG